MRSLRSHVSGSLRSHLVHVGGVLFTTAADPAARLGAVNPLSRCARSGSVLRTLTARGVVP
jgi:hypothetical protein